MSKSMDKIHQSGRINILGYKPAELRRTTRHSGRAVYGGSSLNSNQSSKGTLLISKQCKHEKHGKKEHEVTGQELAHLLGAAERKKSLGKRLSDGVDYTASICSLFPKNFC